MKSAKAKWLLRGVQLVIIGLVFFFVGRTIVQLWPAMRATRWNLSAFPLALSVIVGLACQGMLVIGWRLSLRLVGAQIGWQGALLSQLLGQLAKYVPGKLMTLIGKVYLALQAGVGESQATLAMFVEVATQIVTALAVGMSYVVVVVPTERWWLPIAGAIAGLMVVSLHPAVLPKAVSGMFRLAGRAPIALCYDWSQVLPLLGCYVMFWCISGIGLWLVGQGVGLPLGLAPLTAGYALSWVIGFLSFIFPGGLGVREYAFARFLAPTIELGAAMSIALISRAWLLVAELVCAVGVWVWRVSTARQRGLF
ncbi:MAG: lysylphosphatidylglycerol synthase domain-containing protein [Candidatus Zipacnadales bacterium]